MSTPGPVIDPALIAVRKHFNSWELQTCGDVGPHLTCDEAEGLAKVFLAIGLEQLAMGVIYGHAGSDEDPAKMDTDDRHVQYATEDAALAFVRTLL